MDRKGDEWRERCVLTVFFETQKLFGINEINDFLCEVKGM